MNKRMLIETEMFPEYAQRTILKHITSDLFTNESIYRLAIQQLLNQYENNPKLH